MGTMKVSLILVRANDSTLTVPKYHPMEKVELLKMSSAVTSKITESFGNTPTLLPVVPL